MKLANLLGRKVSSKCRSMIRVTLVAGGSKLIDVASIRVVTWIGVDEHGLAGYSLVETFCQILRVTETPTQLRNLALEVLSNGK